MSINTLTVLGLETSCDDTAAAVVRVGPNGVEVLSSIVGIQEEHTAWGGVVPELAARAHVETIDVVARQAMAEAGIGFDALDGVAATAGPGLIGGVMVGLAFGKAVALARGLPLVAVNHLEGHAVSARLAADIPYPFLLLLVSGGHCQLLEVGGVGQARRLGTTIDDAAGEAFDKIAKSLGLPYPGGPALEKLAADGDPRRFALPKALVGRKDCDFSFSGLKTAAAKLAQQISSPSPNGEGGPKGRVGLAHEPESPTLAVNAAIPPQEGREREQARADLAAAAQAAIAWQLAERTERAMRGYAETHDPADRRFVVAGGVAANGAVRAALQVSADKYGFSFDAPPLRFCTDNAAMIALAGAERLALGLVDGLDAPARPRWPLDEAAALANPVHSHGRKGAKA